MLSRQHVNAVRYFCGLCLVAFVVSLVCALHAVCVGRCMSVAALCIAVGQVYVVQPSRTGSVSERADVVRTQTEPLRCNAEAAVYDRPNTQHASDNRQHGTLTCNMQHATTCNLQHAACNMQHATCSMQHAAKRAACNMQHAAQRAACSSMHTKRARSET